MMEYTLDPLRGQLFHNHGTLEGILPLVDC